MKYPRINNWLGYYQSDDDTTVIVDRLYEIKCSVSHEIAEYAKKLDGRTSPYAIDTDFSCSDVKRIISLLDEVGLLRHSRILIKYFGTIMLTLFMPKCSGYSRVIAYFINSGLLFLWFPVLLIGIVVSMNNLPDFNIIGFTIGEVIGTVIGTFMHELAHGCAVLGYGGRLFEMGIMIRSFVPGAYILADERNIKKRMKRVQVDAAGVEMNLLLTGLFFLLSASSSNLSTVFLGMAINNALFAIFNLVFFGGSDGMLIIQELLSIYDLSEKTKSVIRNNRKRELLMKQGVTGYAVLAVCYLLMCIQITIPLVVIFNIVVVILCFR